MTLSKFRARIALVLEVLRLARALDLPLSDRARWALDIVLGRG